MKGSKNDFSVVILLFWFVNRFVNLEALSGAFWWMALLWGIGGLWWSCVILHRHYSYTYLRGKALAKHYNPKSPFRHWLIREIAHFCNFWLGVRYHVEGLERIPKDHPFVIYTNHQGFLDMFIFFVVLKDYPHASLYKDSHDRNPLIGGMAKALGGMGLDRENDFKAAETIIKVIREYARA